MLVYISFTSLIQKMKIIIILLVALSASLLIEESYSFDISEWDKLPDLAKRKLSGGVREVDPRDYRDVTKSLEALNIETVKINKIYR